MIQGTKVQIPSTAVVKIEIDLPTATLMRWAGRVTTRTSLTTATTRLRRLCRNSTMRSTVRSTTPQWALS